MQSTRARSTPLWASLLVLLVAACAGGGSGGGSDAPAAPPSASSASPASSPEVAFSSFQAIQPSQTVVMSGVQQGGDATVTGSTGNWTVTSSSSGAVDANGTLKLT